MINLEIPKKLKPLITNAHQVALGMFRPISRKYDRGEHEYPKELDMLGAILRGAGEGGASAGVGSGQMTKKSEDGAQHIKNGANMATLLGTVELCWGDVGLLLTLPGQGLGNAAIDAVATKEQRERFSGRWASMAITEPGAGSDSAAIRTTARLEDDPKRPAAGRVIERCEVINQRDEVVLVADHIYVVDRRPAT